MIERDDLPIMDVAGWGDIASDDPGLLEQRIRLENAAWEAGVRKRKKQFGFGRGLARNLGREPSEQELWIQAIKEENDGRKN